MGTFPHESSLNLREELAHSMQGTVVLMGIGNPCRGDDAAGSLVARKLSDASCVHVIDAQDVPENCLWQVVEQQPDTVVLIDSVDLQSPPGAVALLDKEQTAGYWPSTHRVPISLLMDYLERETHARVLLIGIQPYHTDSSGMMSAAVSSSVQALADVLKAIIGTRGVSTPAEFASQFRKAVT